MKNYSENSAIKEQPAETKKMDSEPVTLTQPSTMIGSNLKNKVAIITGGDSGIGQSVAFLYAQHGIHVVIVYYDEDEDAQETINQLHILGVKAEAMKGDI